jgi:hypothetical protein
MKAVVRGVALARPDLSDSSSGSTSGSMTAPLRMEQSVEVAGGPSQLVQNALIGEVHSSRPRPAVIVMT